MSAINCAKLASELSRLTSDLNEQQRILIFATSSVIASKLALPTSPVDDPQGYYLQTLRLQVNDYISRINECVVTDFKYILEGVFNLWLGRYYAAHPKSASFLLKSIFNQFEYFSLDEIEWFNNDNNRERVELISNFVCDILFPEEC